MWQLARRTAALALASLTAVATAGDLTTPASVDFQLTTPTEDYFFWVDNDPDSDHYYPVLKALEDTLAIDRTGAWSIGNPQGYDHGYELLDFAEPWFSEGDRNIFYWDCADAGCDNGLAQWSRILMPAPKWIPRSASCTRNTLGHELFHKITQGYSANDTAPDSFGNWVIEGHARALQDKIYDDFDTDPTADCVTTYLGQIESYLKDDHNVSLWNLSYDAALWWAYLMEQFGEIEDEPRYGADFLVTWYEEALDAGDSGNSFDVTDSAIKVYDPGNGITSTFRRFVLANITKDMDLSAWSDDFRRAYSYVDEQAPGQDLYATVSFDDNLAISNASNEDTTVFATDDYAAQYYKINVSGCESGRVIRIGFEPAAQDPFFGNPLNQLGAWGVLVAQSSDGSQSLATQSLKKFYKKLDEDWAVEFFQPYTNPYETVYATTSGIGGVVLGVLRARCLPPPPNPYAPDVPLVNPLDPQTPGPPDVFTYGEVCAVPTEPLPALDPTEYTVAVGGHPAPILGARVNDDGHCLLIEYPQQPLPGAYDLTVGLNGNEVTVPAAVVHNEPAPNVIIAIDTSTTMLSPSANPKLDDVKAAVGAFIAHLVPSDPNAPLPRIGLISFAGNDVEPDLDAFLLAPLTPATPAHLALLEDALDAGLVSGPGRFTSIGDAIQVALDQFAANGDPAQSRHLVLIADGPENEGAFVGTPGRPLVLTSLYDSTVAAGVNVHTIALGPLADQPLMYRIAHGTGGRYWYVDVDGNGADLPALLRGLIPFAGGPHVRVFSASIPLEPSTTRSFYFGVPPAAGGLLLPAILTGTAGPGRKGGGPIGTLTLKDPAGTTRRMWPVQNSRLTPFLCPSSDCGMIPGRWTLELTTTADASGELVVDVLAEREVPLFVRPGTGRPEADSETDAHFIPGDAVRLELAVADACAVRGACSAGTVDDGIAMVTFDSIQYHVDLEWRSILPMLEQGTLYQTAKAMVHAELQSPSGAPDDGLTGRRGSHTVEYRVDFDYGDYIVTAIAHDAFAVLEGSARESDADADGLPDGYEDPMDCLDAATNDADGDPDDDGLTSLDEFQRGTHPCRPDSDGGGELDGSEVAGARQPLLARDDLVGGIDFAVIDRDVTHAQPRDFLPRSLVLRYGADKTVTAIEVYRGTRVSRDMAKIADLNHAGARGEYVDTNLKLGTEYCYRLYPFDNQGNAGRPSGEFCGVALEDPARPWGAIEIAGGRPRTDDATVEITIDLYNKDPASSEMRLLGPGLDTGWIPYAPTYEATITYTGLESRAGSAAASPLPPSGLYAVRVRLRDAQGLVSETGVDDIGLWVPGSLGDLTGRVLLEGVGPSAGTEVWFDIDRTPGSKSVPISGTGPWAITDADGTYRFTDLLPGTYTVHASRGGTTQSLVTVYVRAGTITSAPDLVLPLGSERIFASGFED